MSFAIYGIIKLYGFISILEKASIKGIISISFFVLVMFAGVLQTMKLNHTYKNYRNLKNKVKFSYSLLQPVYKFYKYNCMIRVTFMDKINIMIAKKNFLRRIHHAI